MMRRNRNRSVSSALSRTGCSPLSRRPQRNSNSVPPIRSQTLSPLFESEGRRRHSAAPYTDWRYAPANLSLDQRQNLIRPTWQYIQPGELPARTLDRVNGIAVDESDQNQPNGRRSSVIFRHNSGISRICGHGPPRPRILPVPSGAAFQRKSPSSQGGRGIGSVVRDCERAGSSRMNSGPAVANGGARIDGCSCARRHRTTGQPPHGGAGPPLHMAGPLAVGTARHSPYMDVQPGIIAAPIVRALPNAFGNAMCNSTPKYNAVGGIHLNPKPCGPHCACSDPTMGVRCRRCQSFVRRDRGDGQEADSNSGGVPPAPHEGHRVRLGPSGVMRVAAAALMCRGRPLYHRTGHALARIVSYSKNSSDDEDAYDICEKVILLGDTGVGKTCMMVRYRSGRFRPNHITTLGIDFRNKVVVVDQTRVKLQIWDTAGQERFRSVTHAYYRDAHALLLLYDVTNKNTFDNIRAWLGEIREYANDTVVIVLIGNKADCSSSDRQVKREDGERLAREHQVPFLETSAKTGQNVELAFAAVARQLKSRTSGNGVDGRFNVHDFVRDQTRARTMCSQCKSM